MSKSRHHPFLFSFTYKEIPKHKENYERDLVRDYYYNYSLVDLYNQRIIVDDYTDEQLQSMWTRLEIFTDLEYRNARRRTTLFTHSQEFNTKEIREHFKKAKLYHKRKKPDEPVNIPESILKARAIQKYESQEKASLLFILQAKGSIPHLLNILESEPETKKQCTK